MKYLEVKLEGNKSLLVDENTNIRDGDWYLDDTNSVRKSITSDKDYWLQRPDYSKIIATINFPFDKDIPMVIVEDEIEKLAELKYPLNDALYIHSVAVSRRAYIAGYKAAQQTGGYSKEDIKQFGLWLGSNIKKYKNKTIDELFIEFDSAVEKYVELEMEVNKYSAYGHDVFIIKTDRIDDQLVAYIKK